MTNPYPSPTYLDYGEKIAVFYQEDSHLVDKDGFDAAHHTEVILLFQDIANARITLRLETKTGEEDVYKIVPTAILQFFQNFDMEIAQGVLNLIDPVIILKTLRDLGIEPRSQSIKSYG